MLTLGKASGGPSSSPATFGYKNSPAGLESRHTSGNLKIKPKSRHTAIMAKALALRGEGEGNGWGDKGLGRGEEGPGGRGPPAC